MAATIPVDCRAGGSGRFAHHISATKRIGHAHPAFGISAPFAINNEAVGTPAGSQLGWNSPDSIVVLLHRDSVLVLMGKIANKQNTARQWRSEVEGLLRRRIR